MIPTTDSPRASPQSVVRQLIVIVCGAALPWIDNGMLDWVAMHSTSSALATLAGLYAMIATRIIGTLFIIFFATRSGSRMQSMGFVKPRMPVDAICASVVALYGWILSEIRAGFLSAGVSFGGLNAAAHSTSNLHIRCLRVAMVVIVIPFFEEVAFRASALSGATGKQRIIMIFASSVMFGLAHWDFGFSAVCWAFAWGIGLSIIFLIRKSIWPVVVGHIAWNLYVVACGV